MKYIDAGKLIKSVNNYQEGAKAALNPTDGDANYYKGKIDACEDIQEFITSLHQEQQEEKERKKADIIMEFTGINAYKPITSMTMLELYDLIKLAVNRKQEDY